MNKQDWIRKLTSRKFWVAIAGFVAGLVAFFKSPTGTPEAITSLIMSFGAVVAYIVGEGLADAAGAKADMVYWEEDKPPEEEP
jgi:ABC-type uncharacterized transport system permease subunit